MKRLAFVLLAACGGGGSSGDVDAPTDPLPDAAPDIDSPPAVFTLTSTAYSEGMTIPMVHTCDGGNGGNTSPQLDWIGAPAGTLSFAIVFTDNTNGLIHSVIYDIPANLTGLPADVEKVFAPTDVQGAHQTRTLGGGLGYRGPCPPMQDAAHIYEFALYALDVATLPNLDMNSTQPEGEAEILMHDIDSALLTGMYER